MGTPRRPWLRRDTQLISRLVTHVSVRVSRLASCVVGARARKTRARRAEALRLRARFMCVHWCRSAFSMRLDVNEEEEDDEDGDGDGGEEERTVGGHG